jgi:hypothetical protein
MANIKFSAFTSGATTANTRIVGYDSTGNTNNQYTLAQLATGLSSSLPTIYSADSSLAAARTVTMGTYNLNFASTTAGQQVSFDKNVRVDGQGFTELHTGITNMTFDWDNGNVQSSTMGASSPTYILNLSQTGTVTVDWDSKVKWPGNTAPTLSGSGKTDVITLICYNDSGAGLYYGSSTLDFTT